MVLAMLLGIGGCKKSSKKEETTPETQITSETSETTTETSETTTEPEETEPSETLDPLYDPNNPMAINPLTGVQDMDPDNVGIRGVSVVINNHRLAIPQRGFSEADMYYEYETEGGQTRMLISFADMNLIPEVGSIRSARIISTDLAAGMNTIFIHWGRNDRVPYHISYWGIDHFDINGTIYSWRESDWSSRPLEHTGVTDGEHIIKAIEDAGINTEAEIDLVFNFVADMSKNLINAESCSSINVYFSPNNPDAEFTYDPSTGLYSKTQYGGKPQIDETTGEQIAVTNVFVIFADICMNGDGYTIDAYFQYGGTGYYVSAGKICSFTWEKPTPNDKFVFYDENGDELEVNRGKSYICVVDQDNIEDTTWEVLDTVDLADE